MSTRELRQELKKTIDKMPLKRLETLSNMILLTNRPGIKQRLAKAEKQFADGKGVKWRKAESDV